MRFYNNTEENDKIVENLVQDTPKLRHKGLRGNRGVLFRVSLAVKAAIINAITGKYPEDVQQHSGVGAT